MASKLMRVLRHRWFDESDARRAVPPALSEQLRAEMHGKGITVSVLCPAFFRTNLLESWQGNPKLKKIDREESNGDKIFGPCVDMFIFPAEINLDENK